MKKQPKADKDNIKKTDSTSRRTSSDWDYIAAMLAKGQCDTIESFYLNLDIPRTTFYEAISKNPKMKEAHQRALELIGIREEKIAKEKFLSMNTINVRQLPHYLDRWKKDFEWHQKIKNDAHDDVSVPKIIIDHILADKKKDNDN